MFLAENVKICKICNEEVVEDSHYYKKHKIKRADYFSKYFPRFDLLTNEPIPFKAEDSYFLTDFINKNNLKTYLKQSSEDEKIKYCKNFIQKRKNIKQLKYTFTQVELRSLVAPTILTFNEIFKNEGGYNKYCESIGLINKFEVLKDKIPDIVEIPKGKIIIDTREQKPLIFKTSAKIECLPYGDYHFEHDKFNIFIERKSLNDFLSTIGQNIERFEREIERAQQDKAFLIVLIESNLNQCLSFNYLPHIKRYTKQTPEHIFHNVRYLSQKYNNLQFLFADGRINAVQLLNKIFFSGVDFSKFDNQLALEMKLI